MLSMKDVSGRKLYQVKEFDKETGIHLIDSNIQCSRKVLGTKADNAILESGVTDLNGNSLALRKIAFAKNIAIGIFSSVEDDFTSFIPLFDEIQDLIKKFAFLTKK